MLITVSSYDENRLIMWLGPESIVSVLEAREPGGYLAFREDILRGYDVRKIVSSTEESVATCAV